MATSYFFPLTVLNPGGSGCPVTMTPRRFELYTGFPVWTGINIRWQDHEDYHLAYNECRGPEQTAQPSTVLQSVLDVQEVAREIFGVPNPAEAATPPAERPAGPRPRPRKPLPARHRGDTKAAVLNEKINRNLTYFSPGLITELPGGWVTPYREPKGIGPGTALKQILKDRYGITASGGCECNKRAAEMDRRGPQWCREHVDSVASWLQKGAAERMWLKPVLAVAGGWAAETARRLVLEACERSEQSGGWPPIPHHDFREPVRRNLLLHIYPVAGTGVWQWNVEHFLKRIDLFNGRRVVAVATDNKTDSPWEVKRAFRGEVEEFIHANNVKKLRETVTFTPLLSQVESLDPNEVTFYCHAKAVTKQRGSIPQRWQEMQLSVCLDDWPFVRESLKDHGIAGAFKRYGQFKGKGSHLWHYSGTAYWFRHDAAFSRNWRYILSRFYGNEAWPGLMFRRDEGACLFHDETQNLYKSHYFRGRVEPAFTQWQERHGLMENTA